MLDRSIFQVYYVPQLVVRIGGSDVVPLAEGTVLVLGLGKPNGNRACRGSHILRLHNISGPPPTIQTLLKS